MSLKKTYQDIIGKYQDQLGHLSKRTNLLSGLRITAFLIFVICLILFLSTEGKIVYLIISIISFVSFLILVKIFEKIRRERDLVQNTIHINEEEINILDYKYTHLEDGKEFSEEEHPYLHDLDIFGIGSLFQYINRTSTRGGKKKLADWISSPTLETKTLQKRQKGLADLSDKVAFRQDFQAIGMLIEENDEDLENLEKWMHHEPIFMEKAWIKIVRYVSPALVLGTGLLASLGFVPNFYFLIAVLVQILWYGPFVKKVQALHSVIDKNLKILSKYASLFELVSKENFSSELMKEHQATLQNPEASVALRTLTTKVDLFNQRSNIFVGGLINLLVAWDVQTVIGIENWLQVHKSHVKKWLETIDYIDALNSLATFEYNHPKYTYPTLEDKTFSMDAKSIGHPLIHRDKLVTSDFGIDALGKFYLITGSNMAGKSTFLRAIGVNMVLAMAGAVVCAEEMSLVPIPLFSSMRTSDSLKDSESYFYAELKRLKYIIDRLKDGQSMFVILDEILKGTNSEDKQAGSKAFIEQLIGLPAVGLLATHDLVLAKLEDTYPTKVHNYCFEMEIQEDELSFSYQLQRGVCSSFNATFLMKKMDIIP